jgi:hypothetical protein
MEHSNDELRDLSGHVLWHVRQLARHGGHLESRRKSGMLVMSAPSDAAALEVFLIHARALTEFLWRSRTDRSPPRETDGLAEDYFEEGEWQRHRPPKSDRVGDMIQRVGSGLAHVSYKRLDPDEARGWDFGELGFRLYVGLQFFVVHVSPERVVEGFVETLLREFHEHFRIQDVPWFGKAVGTPGHAVAEEWDAL